MTRGSLVVFMGLASARSIGAQQPPVDLYMVSLKIRLRPELRHHNAIYGDTAFGDQFLRFAPTRHTGLRKNFL